LPHILCTAASRGRAPAAIQPAMSAGITKTGAVADEFEARAATFRRIAGEMKDPEDRAELLRIAAAYEEDAARLKAGLTRP